MGIEIQSKTNLLSSFSQTKLNYQSPEFKPAQPQETKYVPSMPDKTQELEKSPQKDEFVSNTTQKPPSKRSFSELTHKYGGVATGSAALLTSVIGLPLVYKQAKKGNAKLIGELQDTLTDVSKKLKDLDIETQVKDAVKEATKNLSTEKGNQPITDKQSQLTTALLGLGSGMGIAEFLKCNKAKIKEQGFTDDEITAAQENATAILDKPKEALNKANEVHGMASEARSVAYDAKNLANAYDTRISGAVEDARNAIDTVGGRDGQIMKMFTKPYYDLRLMAVRAWDKKIDINRSEEVMPMIRDAAALRINRSAEATINDIKAYKEKYPQLTSQWGLTAEYVPMKKGGLGVVPVDLQDNFTKLGIDSPTFIPMYQKKNQGEFKKISQLNPLNDRWETHYTYKYGKDTFKLDKLAETVVPTYRNGKVTNEKVEYFSTELPIPGSDKKKSLIFVKNDDYFRDDLYDNTPFAEEPERFAMFTKSVYTLAKYKVASALGSNLTGVENLTINNKKAFDKLKAPNSMVLNDWHAGSMAGLLRYRAPMEYIYKELDTNVFSALKDMPLLMIGHNLGVQGASNSAEHKDGATTTTRNQTAENIINTLYDQYAIAVTENAHSGIHNEDVCNTVLLKRTAGDKHFNHLFNGMALSDWFEIVSPNHAKECTDDPSQSGIVWNILQARQATGTTGGILNGLDKNKVDMQAVSENNYIKNLKLEIYDENTPIDEVMEKRSINKRKFYNQYFKPLVVDRTMDNGPEVVSPNVGNLNISEEDFMNAPLISFAHRLSGQKGLRHLKGATFKLFDNWNELFPGKPLPIILAGGPPESADELVYLNELRNPDFGENKARLDRVVCLKGNLPNPAIMSASTFFMGPSDYEPCGLIQGEAFAKGTPIIATDVGGFHDTVVDGKTGFLAKEPSEQAVYDKMVEALKMYFYEYDNYKQMVAEDLKIDFSWAQPGHKGSIFEYTDKMGFVREELPDVAA